MGKLTHGSLFSGIGGFDLAAEWAGWENKFHCEWNEFGKRVLNYYWPEVECYGDITKTDFRKWGGQIDALTGGFPCQPYSVAGKRLGKEDERHLWPHMLRAIREIKPKYVVGENVRGIISWNGGLVFDEVQADLEAEGYTVIPCVLPACGVNAPHRRERVWFVAVKVPDKDGWGSDKQEEKSCVGELGNVSTGDNGRVSSDNGEATTPYTNNARNTASRSGIVGDWTENIIEREFAQSEFSGHGFTADPHDQRGSAGLGSVSETNGEISQRNENAEPRNASKLFAANSASERLEGCIGRSPERERFTSDSSGYSERNAANSSSSGWVQNDIERQSEEFEYARPCWDNFPTQPPICGGDDGLSRELDGITFPKWRSESIKAYGNAIVPAVAFEIFKVINEIDKFLNENSYLL